MKKVIYKCDIKDCTNEVDSLLIEKKLQIIFTTEQTEGKNTTPYLSEVRIDMCRTCWDKVLKGNYVFGCGAMGNNEYYFTK